MVKESPFPTVYEEIIFKTRYARWIDKEGRRENWDETVDRLVDYYRLQTASTETPSGVWDDLRTAVYNLEVMPSMRALMTAGPAMDRCSVPAYNCAYLPIDSPRSFDEMMYILMCGTGVGYSVEDEYVRQLPKISEEFADTETVVQVADSKEGWSKAFREVLSLLIAGQVPKWDVSNVRPAGSRLKTFGGRASGPEPLVSLFEFTVRLLKGAAGRRLTSLECHDLACKIADIVVVGGVRRSALISLSDVTDDRLRAAKTGMWWEAFGHRALANNSAVYPRRRPDMEVFMREWKALYDSKSGERGLFSRYACQHIAARNGRRDATFEFGTNPCSEIILRPFQFCNLTEVVVRSGDTLESLKRKVRIATILGTIQSTFTDFKYLRKIWKTNCEEERLLGVSFTGILDNPSMLTKEILNELRDYAVQVNLEWSERLGINPATAITCVKPSGTVSQLCDTASGLHPRHSPYYLRTIRADNKDPVTTYLKDAGIYWEADITKPETTTVFYFARKSPVESIDRNRIDAIGQLELWELLQDEWCEHKPSCTVYVREEEWMSVGAWVYDHFDKLSGVSFLPYDGGTYKQAPYQEVTEQEYYEWLEANPLPELDWNDLRHYETEDHTTSSQEFACVGNTCEI